MAEARQQLLRLYQAALPLLAERRNRRGDGLTRLQMHILHVLEREGPQPMREVAARLGVSATSATEIADALVRRSLAVRLEDPGDRRVRLMHVTQEGLCALDRMRGDMAAELERALGALDGDERGRLIDLVSKLLARLAQEDRQSS